jgi:3'-phosphoadenosine 5'-phosphosulfate sulfotransferase (PAPS reductase)/FAD synthetase
MNNIYYVSGGKDSTAMLLNALERGDTIDKAIFLDTKLEFPELYEYLDRVDSYISEYGIKIDRVVTSPHTFEHFFYRPHKKGQSEGTIQGFPYAAFSSFCWIRREFKKFPKPGDNDCHHIGIAYDERHRTKRKTYTEEVECVGCGFFAGTCSTMTTQVSKHYKFPLIEAKMTERDCIDFLEQRDLINPLYEYFKRIGCWLCPYQSKVSLQILYLKYPKLWNKLLEYEKDSPQGFLSDGTLEDLGEIFTQRLRFQQATL